MEGKKRTALESYNYSYMYPGNPDSPTTCDIAPARISHTFKPFYESLFAWSRDDEMARLFDRVETDFDVAKVSKVVFLIKNLFCSHYIYSVALSILFWSFLV